MNDKKEKCVILVLAGILLLIVCLPVRSKETKTQAAAAAQNTSTSVNGAINNGSYFEDKSQNATAALGQGSTEHLAECGSTQSAAYAEQLERELEELLTCMEGAGRVRVMITLRSTSESIIEKDRPANRSAVTENDGQGGSRSTNDMDSEETTVFVRDSEGREIPYVRKTLSPVVEGVAVLAEGGGIEEVRKNISETIQALFGIDVNKIKIAKMKTAK